MSLQIDEDAINKAKILDISKPPVKEAPAEPYPFVVYHHPKDKSKEHKVKVVRSKAEHDAALKAGWANKPHVPEVTDIEVED